MVRTFSSPFASISSETKGARTVPDYLGTMGAFAPGPSSKAYLPPKKNWLFKKFLSLWGFQLT
jgi:hypothetical protein